jgi:hypothetical protein
MAVTEKWILVSEGQIYDADSSTSVHVICDEGAPSGAADPQASANKGSLYFRTDASDDEPCLYVKTDEDSADDDWRPVIIDNDAATKTIGATWTWGTSNAIQLRDSGQKLYSSADGYGWWALTGSDVMRIGDQANSHYIQVAQDGEMTVYGNGMINSRYRFELLDDFIQQTLTEADTPWILNKGSDGAAKDPAITASGEECGVVQLETGAGDGSTAQDGSQLVCHIPVQADSGGLVFETRLHIDTAITNIAVNAGLTDSTNLEEPFTIGGGDAITSTASDAACFVYDTGAATDEWFACAVDSDADDAGCATTGTAPVADTYQTLRIEVSSDGATIRFYINGTLAKTLSGDAGVTPNVNLYATVIACGDGTLSKTVDVDYIYVGHVR